MVKVKEGSVKIFHKNIAKKSPFVKKLLHYTNGEKEFCTKILNKISKPLHSFNLILSPNIVGPGKSNTYKTNQRKNSTFT